MIKIYKYVILTIVLTIVSGCAGNGGAISVNPSQNEMSIALRTMALTGNQKYFVDVDRSYYEDEKLNGAFDKSTPAADTLAAVGYFTDHLSGIGNASKIISNNAAGTMQLAIALLDSHENNLKRLDRNVFAFIPKSEAATKEDAEKLFFESVINAVYNLVGDSSKVDVVRYTGHGLNGYRFFTEEKIFMPGKGYLSQGSNETTGDPTRAKVFIHKIKHASYDPTGDRIDCFYIRAFLHIPAIDEENWEQRGYEELIKFSRLMPDWYYQFLMIDKTPVVLSSDRINLFVKPGPKKEQITANAENK